MTRYCPHCEVTWTAVPGVSTQRCWSCDRLGDPLNAHPDAIPSDRTPARRAS